MLTGEPVSEDIGFFLSDRDFWQGGQIREADPALAPPCLVLSCPLQGC